jgi:hypothetical protein
MTFVRLLRWIVLLSALFASVSWSYISIDHLLDSSMNQQQRTSEYNSTPQPESMHLHQLEQSQMKWGRQSLFSVACSFLILLTVLMNWVLDGRTPRVSQKVN